jgi:hypothetical protein
MDQDTNTISTMTDADNTTFNNGSSPVVKTNNIDPLETAKWTSYLPETFGLREAVRKSSYRWCVREGYVCSVLNSVHSCDCYSR